MDSVGYEDTQANFGVYGINVNTDLTGIVLGSEINTNDTHIQIEGKTNDRDNA